MLVNEFTSYTKCRVRLKPEIKNHRDTEHEPRAGSRTTKRPRPVDTARAGIARLTRHASRA